MVGILRSGPSIIYLFGNDVSSNILSIQNTTAKEHLRAQQHAQGSRQRHQEEEAHQARFHPRNGPQVLAKPKVLQEVQQVQAGCRVDIV